MKKRSSIIHNILILTCVCLITAGCANQPGTASAPPPNSGRLIIDRVANFGSNMSLVVSIDGKDVGSFTEGQSYSGYLSAGSHNISARVDPNQSGARPGRRNLIVESGKTYSYTAGWSSGNVVLVKNQGQTVPTY